jgi:hypothetical protein
MNKGRVLALGAVVLLAACHGDAGQTPAAGLNTQSKAPAVAKRGPSPEELTAGMVEAVTVGKSTVPVTVKFELPARPQVGQPLDIVLAVLPGEAADGATVKVTGSTGLEVAREASAIGMGPVDPTQAYKISVSVTPTAEGVLLLALDVALKHDDVTDTRSFTVPVLVGSAESAPVTAKH